MFHSHLTLSKKIWLDLVPEGKTYIDATCGNGHDTFFLASNLLNHKQSKIYAIDIQEDAIKSTRERLKELPAEIFKRIHLLHQSHENFPEEIKNAALIVYNLGYLPGSDKQRTTMTASTIKSLSNATNLIESKGVISITLYPGHPEGERETQTVLNWCSLLPPNHFSVQIFRTINKPKAPFLLILKKK